MAPEREQLAQAVRNRLGAAVVAPEGRIGALRQHVVQLQKIDHALPAIGERVVEAPRDDVHRRARRRHLIAQHRGRQLDQREGGGLERLDEAGRQSDRHAVAVPELARDSRD